MTRLQETLELAMRKGEFEFVQSEIAALGADPYFGFRAPCRR